MSTSTFGQAILPFSSPLHIAQVEPPRVADQVVKGKRRAVVTSVDADRDNSRKDVVLCVTWLDTGTDGVLFWGEIDYISRR